MDISTCSQKKQINLVFVTRYEPLIYSSYTVKRVSDFPVPSWMSLTKLPLPGLIKLFPARESLICDIPAGDGKITNLFFRVYVQLKHLSMFYHPCSESPTQNSQYSNSQTYASQNILPGIIGTRTETYPRYNYQELHCKLRAGENPI